jgi:glutathione S-transferase
MSKIQLGYWDLQGLGEPIRYLLHHKGVDFEEKRYTVGPPPEYSNEWFPKKFSFGLDFPNLPYLFDGDVKLTQVIIFVKLVINHEI